jgi:uncharacterized protein YjbK
MADYNGDLRLLAHQISELTVKVGKFDGKLETNIAVHNSRLREAEKQSALQELSLQTLCQKVESLDTDVKHINLVSKVIGGIAGGLAVVAAAIGISK